MSVKQDSRRALSDDGLSVRRARPRHDEAQPPTGHVLTREGWPVRDPGRVEKEQHAERAARERKRLAKLLAEYLRARAKGRIYERVRQHWGKRNAPLIERCRTGAAPFAWPPKPRVFARRGGEILTPPGTEARPIAVTGAEIVEHLVTLWELPLDERTRDRLAKAIDAVPEEAVNVGGAGGRNQGQTPEAWAHLLVLGLTNPDAAEAERKRRARRRRRA